MNEGKYELAIVCFDKDRNAWFRLPDQERACYGPCDQNRPLKAVILNRETKAPIPDDEPLFILRARDQFAIYLLLIYQAFCIERGCLMKHVQAMKEVVSRFRQWERKPGHRPRLPD